MAITTAEAFLAVLEKSELLTTEQFAEAQDATLLTSYASELAEMLIQQDMITPWQSTQLLAGRSSLFLGNYALMDLLGRGGMGSVFLARHRTMKRRVALKVVSKQVGKDPASLERFLAEARLIASLDHPNIVQAYDVDKESDRFYIVMEYIEGQDLDVLVQEHGLFGFEEVADCIRQAADGLAHAHGRKMIHCDIKPSNLLLSDQGVIKILDMGMARLAGSGEDSGEQVDHKVLGTVDYMSPEQAMNGPDFDHRADIYSLGCTLYFLLTGRPPFDGGSLTQRIVKHQTQPPPDILEAHPDTPKELVEICMKMMAKDPA
ncbi:MAG: serine/threonine-protein kinase, partial [Planctomycetota bacterium]|nr:serine/threonine-protein kinase [Planctomycetota bacterium]